MTLQSAKYPCPSDPQFASDPSQTGAWFSEYLPDSNLTKEVAFKVDFENISRVKVIKIKWLFVP